MTWDLLQIISDGLSYDLLKYAIGSAGLSVIITISGKYFKRLESSKDIIVAFASAFFITITLFFIVAPRSDSPQLAGSISQVLSGPIPGSGQDTISVMTISILNSGSAQSVVKNWKARVNIGGEWYGGLFISPPPKNFTFNSTNRPEPNDAIAIMYHGIDDIIEKSSIAPVPSGGMVTGILFIDFKGIDANLIKAGAEFLVTFEDARSHSYTASIRTTARPASLVAMPGIHADLTCPVPAKQAPPVVSAVPKAGFSPAPPITPEEMLKHP